MNHHSSTDSPAFSTSSSDAISRRAYELWEKEGRPDGSDLRHWLQAEQELAATTPPSTPRVSEEILTAPTMASDMRPLQGTRAAAAAGRDQKRGSASPFERSAPSSGNSQGAARRKPSSAPAL